MAEVFFHCSPHLTSWFCEFTCLLASYHLFSFPLIFVQVSFSNYCEQNVTEWVINYYKVVHTGMHLHEYKPWGKMGPSRFFLPNNE